MRSIAELRKLVESGIAGLHFSGQPGDLYDPIRYMLSLEAKRMRPVLVLCGCELFGGDPDRALMPALGIEVFHNFTLLHDDIMDNAPLRRSSETVHTRWNTNVAILSGDTMFVKACQLVMQADDAVMRPVMELFHRTAIEVCEGQQMDMDYERLVNVTIPEYITMISLKTAVLLGASLKMGAMIAGAPAADAQHLYEFGKHTGIAFQLKDDILDVFGDDRKFGKVMGGDIVANKKTFLLLRALELAKGDDYSALQYWLNHKSANSSEKVAQVTNLYRKLGVLQLAEREMEHYYRTALGHLDAIAVPDSKKEVLRGFAEKLMVREA
jgi:geranylgeranyl diphosphate synthase type II